MTTYDHTVKMKMKYDEKKLKSNQSLRSSSEKIDDQYRQSSSFENNRSRSIDNSQILNKVVLSSHKLPKLDLQQSQSKFNNKDEKESRNMLKSMNKSNMKKVHDSSFERPNSSTDNKKSISSTLSGSPINELTNSISCIQNESEDYNYFTMLNEKSRPSSVTNTNRNETVKSSPGLERNLASYDKPLFILTNPNGSNTYINFDRSPNDSINKSTNKSTSNSTNIVKLPMNKNNDMKPSINNNKIFSQNDSSQTETDSDHDFNNVNLNNINKFLKKKREFSPKIEPFRKNSISRLNEKLRQDLNRSSSEIANVNIKYNKHNNNNFNNNEGSFIRNNIKNDYYNENRKISEYY